MTEKVKVTFVLPLTLQNELKLKIVKDGYDLKGKSRWIGEAIEQLFTIVSFVDLVKINDIMHGFEKFESIVIPHLLKQQLDQAVVQVRKVYPEMDGVQSRILRTAIMQRLLRF